MLKKLKPSLHFSWKQKLIAITVITIIGLTVVTASAFISLNSVNNSFAKQSTAIDYKKNTQALMIQFLKLESFAENITTDKKQEFIGSLNSIKKLALHMQDQAARLKNNNLTRFSGRLQKLSSDYVKLRKEWLNNGIVLGFSTEEGMLLNLTAALTKLEKESFSAIDDDVSNLIFNQGKFMVSKDPASEVDVEKRISNLETIVANMEWQDNIIGQSILAYRQAFDKTRALIVKEAKITASIMPISKQLKALVNKQNNFLDEVVLQQVKQEASTTRESATTIIFLSAIIVGLIIFFSLSSIARQFNIQLKHMQTFLKSIAEGDLSKKLSSNDNKKDEFTQLRIASNQMQQDISGIISQVIDGNKSLLTLREQLELAVQQLAIASEEVEHKTQQSTVATQQISVAVNDVAKRSVNVSETAQLASQTTQAGGKVINDCVNYMVNIVALIEKTHGEVLNLAQATSKMLGIIDVINGLADQTNLLALNAAIESARAGESGRGFSVVADEVRALAQKTVSATNNIGELIKGFNDQSKRMSDLMEKGIELASSGQENANNAKSSFKTIEGSIQKVATEMDQVVVAVEEISYNSSDIAAQIEHICNQGKATKETRLNMEQQTEKLSSKAEILEKLIRHFKI